MKESGFSVFCKAFQNRVDQQTDVPANIELGTMLADGGLKIDTYNIVLPKGQYSVLVNHKPCEGFSGCSGSEHCSGFSGCKGHKNWEPQAGDRCVVAWIGNEAVILGKIGGDN